MGKVHIKLNNGNECLLKDVRYILVIKINLFSTEKWGDGDRLCTFSETWWNITKG